MDAPTPSYYMTRKRASTTCTAKHVVQRFIDRRTDSRLIVVLVVKYSEHSKSERDILMALHPNIQTSAIILSKEYSSNQRNGSINAPREQNTVGQLVILSLGKHC